MLQPAQISHARLTPPKHASLAFQEGEGGASWWNGCKVWREGVSVAIANISLLSFDPRRRRSIDSLNHRCHRCSRRKTAAPSPMHATQQSTYCECHQRHSQTHTYAYPDAQVILTWSLNAGISSSCCRSVADFLSSRSCGRRRCQTFVRNG